MRLEQTCSCGAKLEIVWSEPRSEYDTQGKAEAKRSKAEIEAFRKQHTNCTREAAS